MSDDSWNIVMFETKLSLRIPIFSLIWLIWKHDHFVFYLLESSGLERVYMYIVCSFLRPKDKTYLQTLVGLIHLKVIRFGIAMKFIPGLC